MSHCIVPNWNVSHQRQDINQGEEGNRSSHLALSNHFQQQQLNHHHSQSLSHQLVPMSNFDEVTELTWENGQLTMHELGGIFSTPTTSTTTSALPKATWGGGVGRASDTLESIVHQATYYNTEQTPNLLPDSAHQHSGHQSREKVGSSVVASCSRKWGDDSRHIQPTGGPPTPPSLALVRKRTRSESENFAARNNTNDREISMCASANAVFCNKDDNNNNDATMMTWASFDSPRSCTRTKTTTDEDSACHGGSENQEEDQKTKGESSRSYTTRKGRAAAVHNQSERRRRDRINQKMKALQKLVPNASKTDKASMLDEVIEYLKQLQAQVQMMTSARFMPQLMMPLGMQQQLYQMSLMARVGMGANLGMGIGMLDATNMKGSHPGSQAISGIIHPNHIATAASAFAPPTFVVPQMITSVNHQPNSVDPGNSNSAALQDPYSALLAQSMNMELYSRMAALQRQQQQTSSQHTSSQLQ